MKTVLCGLILLLFLPAAVNAQRIYQINGVPLSEYGRNLQNAWAGGLNNPVISPIDLNQDGLMDLFVYDKAGWKALSFINTGSIGHPSFRYAPEYDWMYPDSLRDWAVIRDYNHDGVGDIIALTIADDVAVYKGARNGSTLSYELVYPHLFYQYGASNTDHIWTFANNMPIFMDIDGDGALDILGPDVFAVNLTWYRNVATDSGYSADSMTMKFVTSCWGHFTENVNDCNVSFTSCLHDLPDSAPILPRHQGGACWGLHYNRNNPLVSILLSDISCNTTKFLQNTGSLHDANMTYADTLFPVYDRPVYQPLFPGLYGADLDNDGFEDLMAAPFASNGEVPSESQDRNVLLYYHNNAGTDSFNTYHYEGDTLINNSIADAGTESHPVFFDYNGDSLTDIVLGNYGHFAGIGSSGASGLPGLAVSGLTLYKNTGSDTMPAYVLEDSDWNQLSRYNILGVHPAFGDLNGDGLPDMVVGDVNGYLYYFKNRGSAALAAYPAMDSAHWFGINVGTDAAPLIYDVNGDGLNDLVVGTGGRAPSLLGSHLFYYWNFGSASRPMFSPDSVNKFFGNAVVWDSSLGVVEGFSNPAITAENGVKMLYSGSQRGLVFKYAINPDSLRSGSFVQLSANVLGIHPGLRSSISIADINHDGRNDYLVGNIRGGMMLFSDTGWSSSYVNGIAAPVAEYGALRLWPNPARDQVICRGGKGPETLAAVQVWNLSGQPVAAPVLQNDGNGMVLGLNGLAEGIYIVQACSRNGSCSRQKLAIIR